MKEYLVSWEIELMAESAEQAAQLALEVQRDTKSMATVFQVHSEDNTETIDLIDIGEKTT